MNAELLEDDLPLLHFEPPPSSHLLSSSKTVGEAVEQNSGLSLLFRNSATAADATRGPEFLGSAALTLLDRRRWRGIFSPGFPGGRRCPSERAAPLLEVDLKAETAIPSPGKQNPGEVDLLLELRVAGRQI